MIKNNKESEVIRILRRNLRRRLEDSNELSVKFDPNVLEELIFKNIKGLKNYYKTFSFDFDLIKKLDLTGVNFKDVCIRGIDFTGSKGVLINPEEIHNKDLSNTKLYGVEITGSLDGVNIMFADFTGSRGAIVDTNTAVNFEYANLTNCTIINNEETSSKVKKLLKEMNNKF